MPKKPSVTVAELIAQAKAAAAEAADYQERFGAQDIEARKIVDIIERFLRVKGRVVYGGAAINAHLPPEKQFYDPSLYLPDYDFMTPDPLQDCADLIATFQAEGFVDVEAKFGIHEGTYKIFVNYRAAADITYMPPEIYERVIADSDIIMGIRYASVNFLRMNIYLELSRPAGDVKRWDKVYERLLLLNEVAPLDAGNCVDSPIKQLGERAVTAVKSDHAGMAAQITQIGIEHGVIFLSGVSYLVGQAPRMDEPILMLTEKPDAVHATLEKLGLRPTADAAMGELLPGRTEWRTGRRRLVAVVFESVACHAYTTLKEPVNYRLASLDLMIQMYYAMYFAGLQGYVPVRLLCLIQELIEMEGSRRMESIRDGAPAHDVFPLDCIGHQPSMPELKKAHRERVREKRKELAGALRLPAISGVRAGKKRRSLSKRQE
jgi:hypothetical protein